KTALFCSTTIEKTMKVHEVSQKDGWNEFVAKSEFGDILQTWEWGDVKKDELWRPIRLKVEDGNEVVGQALVLSRQLPMGFRLYYMPRGPVLDYRSKKAGKILELILQYISAQAKSEKGLMIKIGPGVSEDDAP